MSTAETSPWILGELIISESVLALIRAHAQEAYPSESCGFVLGPAEEPQLLDEAIREPNEADKYHQLDPEAFPRTSREYFKINELRAQRTFAHHASIGRPVKVIYHSHCDAGAYFSAEDAATFSMEGQLAWPCAFLVTSVFDGAVGETKLWVHRRGTDEFDESTLTIV